MSETAKFANVVLPGASFFEKSGSFTNGERRVQRVNEVIPQPDYTPGGVLAGIARVVPFFQRRDGREVGGTDLDAVQ